MKIIFQPIVICLFFITMQNAIFAQQKPIVATCEGGKGCSFTLSDATYEDLDVLENNGDGKYAKMPKDAMIVYAKVDGKWQSYIEEKKSRSELDKLYGGDGFTMIRVFNPQYQPLNGQWKADVGQTASSPCFAVDIGSIANKILSKGSTGGLITFPDPFNVKFLMNNPNVKWRMINPTVYKATLDFGFGNSSPMKLVYDVNLVNEEKITGVFSATIKVPTKDPCKFNVPVTYTCVKPDKGQRRRDKEIDLFAPPKKFNIDRIDDGPRVKVDRIEDGPKPKVDRLEDGPKPKVDRLEDDPKPKTDLLDDKPKPKPKPELLDDRPKPKAKVDRLEDGPKPKVDRLEDKPRAKVDRLGNAQNQN